VKRFPCLVELLLPEMLAALAGVPGPLGINSKGPAAAAAAGTAAAMDVDGKEQQLWEQWVAADGDKVDRFYRETLAEAMQKQTAPAAAPAAAAAATGSNAAAAAAAKQALAAAVAAAAAGADPRQAAAAAVAAAGADGGGGALPAAAGANTAGSSSVAQESENDGRVCGACAVLAPSLESWRVVFRDPVVFQGFVCALMASRCHSSNACLKTIQMVILQVRTGAEGWVVLSVCFWRVATGCLGAC
jgi:hypothetical protein